MSCSSHCSAEASGVDGELYTVTVCRASELLECVHTGVPSLS